MRYKMLKFNLTDSDFMIFTYSNVEGNISLCSTDELIEITNEIRKEKGYTDLVTADCDNDVYYSFYLVFNIIKREVKICASCNHGGKDDYAWYTLPMTTDEERDIMFTLIECLTRVLYYK